jgi:hypothetical protein
MIGSLIAIALFIICNCAGYLFVTFINPDIFGIDSQRADAVSGDAAPVALTQTDIVTFSTATAVLEGPIPTPLPVINTPAPPTPIPLLPTVTAGPTTTPFPIPTGTAEPLPTATPPPTPEPSPVNQARARETAGPSDLQILSHRTYIDSLGWHHIVGEVQNNGVAPMEFVEIMAKLYDESQAVIGTKLTFTTPDVIFPGSKAPFDVITLRPSQWERIREYKLQVKGDVAEDLLNQNLVLLNQDSRIQDGFLYVTGEVQNTGETPALVKLIVTLYDAGHNVINTNWSYANLGIIPVDQTSPFEVKVVHTTDPNNFSYQIQIEEEAVEAGAELDDSNTK